MGKKLKCGILMLLACIGCSVYAQGVLVTGTLRYQDGAPAKACEIVCHALGQRHSTRSDDSGRFGFVLPAAARGHEIHLLGYCAEAVMKRSFRADSNRHDFALTVDAATELDPTLITSKGGPAHGSGLRGDLLLESKKNHIIRLQSLPAQLGQNNARQTFARIPGLNIAENDAGGLQLSIGSRGLNPNRSAEFNIRQNGYDISADPMGYPDAYYTPPFLALREINVVRGAGALQYGTQFGGLIQFNLKEPWGEGWHGSTDVNIGSFGAMNLFTELSSQGTRMGSYSFLQWKDVRGWRPNSRLQSLHGYTSLLLRQTRKLKLKAEYTVTDYLARQAGGLTDMDFRRDPSQSLRSRNWFAISWHVPAMSMQWKINEHLQLSGRVFGLLGSRKALGNLTFINRRDDLSPRNLLSDRYRNIGSEWRLQQRWNWKGMEITGLAGLRYFNGNTEKWQGLGSRGADADFRPMDTADALQASHRFTGHNAAFFSEWVFRLSPRFSITPGMRVEWLQTTANGVFRDERGIQGDTGHIGRRFPLFGIGSSYRLSHGSELYFNFTQNYRAINLSDIRVINPNMRIDPDMRDESGYTADLGLRGQQGRSLRYDIGVYLLDYRNRIGTVLRYDSSFNIYRFRTNLARALSYGAEWYLEWSPLRKSNSSDWGLSFFISQSFNRSRYVSSPERNVQGKTLEYAPTFVSRSGGQLQYRNWSLALSHHYTSLQYADATNARYTPTATAGTIPAWWVADASLDYSWKRLSLRMGVNNCFNRSYFTRRADSYPGPGIIPAEPRNFFVGLKVGF